MTVPTTAPAGVAATLRSGAWQRAWPWLAYAVALAAAPQLWSSGLGHSVLAQTGIAIIACLSYNVLFGQGGMLSFGHAVYTGLGAFLAMHTLRLVGAGQLALPVSLVPLAGGVAGWAVAAVLGYAITRRAGTTFAMITLGIGELAWAVALMLPEYFGGEGGITGNRVVGAPVAGISFGPPVQMTYLIALYCWLCTLAMYALTRTPLGRLLNAVRDNPQRIEFLGYSARQVRWRGLMAAGFFAGIAGGLGALHFEIVSTEVLGASRSGAYLLFTFLGGAGFFAGPILGAVLMVLAMVMLSQWSPAWLLYVGVAFLLAVVFAPDGLAGLLARHGRRLLREPASRPVYLAWTVAAAAALLGGVAVVEMLYQHQLESAGAVPPTFLGQVLDGRSPAAWAMAGLVAVAGVVLAMRAARRLRCHDADGAP